MIANAYALSHLKASAVVGFDEAGSIRRSRAQSRYGSDFCRLPADFTAFSGQIKGGWKSEFCWANPQSVRAVHLVLTHFAGGGDSSVARLDGRCLNGCAG